MLENSQRENTPPTNTSKQRPSETPQCNNTNVWTHSSDVVQQQALSRGPLSLEWSTGGPNGFNRA